MGHYYSISVDLRNKNCLVIGGGNVALRKAQSLLDCGARVRLIGTDIIPEVKDLKKIYKYFTCTVKPYGVQDLRSIFLVIAATDNTETNKRITTDTTIRGILINVVDKPRLCNFIVPSVLRRGDLSVSISTGGISPALARMVRLDLEKYFGNEYGDLLAILRSVRPRIVRLPDKNKKIIWKKIINKTLLDRIRKKGKKEVQSFIEKIIQETKGVKK